MRNFSYYFIISFAILFGCQQENASLAETYPVTNSLTPPASTPTEEITFSSIFSLKEKIEIAGPIMSSTQPYISEKGIVVNDYIASQVHVFTWNNSHNKIVGSKGQGPGEFIMPSSVFQNKSGNYYVTDLRSKRIQVFDSSWTYRDQISTSGTITKGLSLGDYGFLAIGRVPCEIPRESCKISLYNSNAELVTTFAPFETGKGGGWQVTIDDDNLIYIIHNSLNMIEVYDLNGNEVRKIRLSSPNMVALDLPLLYRGMASSDRIRIMEMLNSEKQTMASGLYATTNYLYLPQKRKFFSEEYSTFFMDIFDYSGELVLGNIVIPGNLEQVDEAGTFYFVDKDEQEDYTNLIITTAILRDIL